MTEPHHIIKLLKEVSGAIKRSQKKDISTKLEDLKKWLGQAKKLVRDSQIYKTHLKVMDIKIVNAFASTLKTLSELLEELKERKNPRTVRRLLHILKSRFEEWSKYAKSAFGNNAKTIMNTILQNIETMLQSMQSKK